LQNTRIAPPRRGVCQVTDFIEPEPGVVFPVRVRRDHYRGGELYETTATSLADVVINKPVPAAALSLPAIPPGTALTDQLEGRRGRIDSTWNWTGPTTPLRRVVKVGPGDAGVTGAAPSPSEPTSTARWVLLVSVAVLLLAAGLVVARRFRRG